jgi:putative membrane protein
MSSAASEKNIFRIIFSVSLLVFILVIVLNRKILPRPEVVPSFVYFLPKLNAIINSVCTILLLTTYYFIRRKKISIHKRINITTFFLSSLFLISYVMYHYFADETKFPADNPLRPVYFTILISHIILAALVLPLVLISFYRGLNMQVPQHRKIARWTFPIWLYVTITGVIVYLMISPYYPF